MATTTATTQNTMTFDGLVDLYRTMEKDRAGRKPALKKARHAVRVLQAHGLLPHTPYPVKGVAR